MVKDSGTSLVGQWLRLHAPNAGGPGSIPGQGTRSHTWQLGMLRAASKTPRSRMNGHHTESWLHLGQARWKRHSVQVSEDPTHWSLRRADLQRPARGQDSDTLRLNPGSALSSWGTSGKFLPSAGPHFPPLSRDSLTAFARNRGHNAQPTGWASQVASDYLSPSCLLLS